MVLLLRLCIIWADNIIYVACVSAKLDYALLKLAKSRHLFRPEPRCGAVSFKKFISY